MAENSLSYDRECIAEALAPFTIPDALRLQAYEQLPSVVRSGLKQTIARLYAVHAPASAVSDLTQHYDGFALRTRATPAPFTLCFCPRNYAYPQCFLAALVPAALAGCSTIIPCFTEEQELPNSPATDTGTADNALPLAISQDLAYNALLGALDLAGIEEAYTLSIEETLRMVAPALAMQPPGRIIILGQPAGWQALVEKAALAGVPALPFVGEPLGGLMSEAAANAQGTLSPMTLSVDAAHQQTWLWPSHSPAWFCNTAQALYALP